MSKRLPRTTGRTLDDLRDAAKETLAAETASTRGPAKPTSSADPKPAAPHQSVTANADPGAPSGTGATRTKPASHVSAAAPAKTSRARSDGPSRAAFRQASGKLIVERHANMAAMAGLIPLPWVDMAAVAVIVERMLRKLARLYGEPLDTHRSKHLASALLTGMAAPGIATFATTSLLQLTPVPGFVGMAFGSVSAAVLVRIVGEVYLSHLSQPAAAVMADAAAV